MLSITNVIDSIEDKVDYARKLVESKGFEVKEVGAGYFIQPCVFCGHHDCLSGNNDVAAVHCFSCKESASLYGLAEKVLGNKQQAVKFLEEYTGKKIKMSEADEKTSRIYEIRYKSASKYLSNLLINEKYLSYQVNTRKHEVKTLEKYLVGLSGDFGNLKQQLLGQGYSNEEIHEAKVYIPDGLFVYPYFDKYGNIVRFNTKNPFHVLDHKGKEISGYSTGEKCLNLSREIDFAEAILVEGENDFLSVIEAGAKSVIALGGTPSQKQIEELGNFKKLYLALDQDDAGERFALEINEKLPHVKILKTDFSTTENFKDVDEFYKKSLYKKPISQLLSEAQELENPNYTLKMTNDTVELINRHYKISFAVCSIDTKGLFRGNFKYIEDGAEKDVKLKTRLDSIGKKYQQYIEPIYNKLDSYYNTDFDEKDYFVLLRILKYTSNKRAAIISIAKQIAKLKNKDEMLDIISAENGTWVRDEILKELNNIYNSGLDPDSSIPYMPAAQAFDIINNRAYFYYNMTLVDDNGLRTIPTLICSDGRQIRLDLIKRKSPQHMLLVDNTFQMHDEIETAIMETSVCSLKSKYANLYKQGIISHISINDMLIRIQKCFEQIYYTEDTVVYKILALYVLSTYFYQLFGVMGYLFLNAEKGSGKSLLSAILSKLCFCCRYLVGTSEAALFRTISSCGGTMILDEMENLTSRDKTADSLMASILKSGYSRDTGYTLRMNVETNRPEQFSLYGPKIISNIYGVEDVLEDRCLKIPIKKYPAAKTSQKTDIIAFELNNKEQIEELTSYACICAMQNFQQVYQCYSSLKLDMGSSRNTQILRPLYAIASIAGVEYKNALNEYYQKYVARDREWTENNSPEGIIRESIKLVANELYFNGDEWISTDYMKKYCQKENNSRFTVNTFAIKLIADQLDGSKQYTMSEIHKLFKRAYPQRRLDTKQRTSISIASYENLTKLMKGQDKVATYVLDFKFTDFVDEWINICDSGDSDNSFIGPSATITEFVPMDMKLF